MRIGIDIMGGDFAPITTVGGSILARKELPADVRLVLIGDKQKIKEQLDHYLESESSYDIIHTSEVIEMAESPLKSITQKPNSSIGVGFQMLKNGDLDAFAGNGNTGAMMVGALLSVKAIEGIQRPCIATMVPMESGGILTILDVGSNADCRPEMLSQFAQLGYIYAKYVNEIEEPRVALLNIGEEDEKGNLVTQAAFQLIKEIKTINFIGNIEGRDILDGIADVIVCEGFVGNVVVKEAEAFYKLIKKRNIKDDYFDRFNYEIYGGSPILGINSTVVIGHGISNEIATKNLILLAAEMVESDVTGRIKTAFKPHR